MKTSISPISFYNSIANMYSFCNKGKEAIKVEKYMKQCINLKESGKHLTDIRWDSKHKSNETVNKFDYLKIFYFYTSTLPIKLKVKCQVRKTFATNITKDCCP